MATNTSDEDSLYTEIGNFYFTTDSLHDVQFIVGEEKEKIKAVRLPLINQSRPWWSMLSQDSPLAEEGDIHITDIEPNIFKLLLKHSYGGLDSLDDLSQDEVMKLCYCANKYMMKSLMKKIANRLQPRDVNGVFPALHCLVYFNLQDVEDSVQKMVQRHTTEVFQHPEFLECDVDSVTYICKQEALNCDEVFLWLCMILWANHKAKCNEGSKLREWLHEPLKHIRLLAISKDDLHEHVFPQDVLNNTEVVAICKGDLSAISAISSETAERYFADALGDITFKIDHDFKSGLTCDEVECASESIFVIKQKTIELKSIVCRSKMDFVLQRNELYTEQYAVDIEIRIKKENSLMKDWISIELNNFKVHYFDRFTIPTVIDDKGIPLLADCKYTVGLRFSTDMPCSLIYCDEGHDFDHGIFYCNEDKGACHIHEFVYSVVSD